MNIIPYLASKYLKFKASDRGISTIAIIAFFTIVISAAAAVVILSAANGFHFNLMEKIMSKDAHVMILGPEDGMSQYEEYINDLKQIPGVTSVIPFFQKQVLIKGRTGEYGSEVMGIPPYYHKDDKDFGTQFHVMDGGFDFTDKKSIVLGENLAQNLGARVGDWVDIMVFDPTFYVLQYRFKVVGIFSAGHKDYDSGLSFISFEAAQLIFNEPNKAYGLAVKVKDPFEVEKYLPAMNEKVPYYKWTWKTLNRNQLAAIDNEQVIMKVILFFFFVVVFFNILSTMIGMVVDKKEEIGILKAMGLKPGDALQVFLFDGFLLGAAGSALGVLLGLFLTVSLNTILHGIEKFIDFINWSAYYMVNWIQPMAPPAHFEFFKSSVYYITEFPIKIMYQDIAFIILLSVAVSTLAVVFPALKASRMRPVEVLRND